MRQQGNSTAVCPGCRCHVLPCLGRIFSVCRFQVEMVFCGGVCIPCVLGRPVYAVFSDLHSDYTVSEEADQEASQFQNERGEIICRDVCMGLVSDREIRS